MAPKKTHQCVHEYSFDAENKGNGKHGESAGRRNIVSFCHLQGTRSRAAGSGRTTNKGPMALSQLNGGLKHFDQPKQPQGFRASTFRAVALEVIHSGLLRGSA